MSRCRLAVTSLSLALALAACSGKKQGPAQPPPPPTSDPAPVTAAPTTAPTPTGPPLDPRERALTGLARRLFEQEHLLQRPIDDEVSRAALTGFLDRVDPSKLYFLAADHAALAAHADRIDDELASGRLDVAHELVSRFAARVAVVQPMVAELLAGPFDHDDVEEVELDPDKLSPAADNEALRARWRQRLELELLERTSAPEDRKLAAKLPPLAEREAKAKKAMADAYAARFARLAAYDVKDADADLINAIAGVLDPHTDYLPPADKANFDIAITGSVEGIGALLRERDHYVEVQELVPGGAAWRQGELVAGDLILSVTAAGAEPVDVLDMRIEDVVKMIRGPKDSVVTLRVRKASGDEKTIAITRDKVVIEAAYARGAVLTGKGLPRLGYIHLPSFYGGQGHDAAGDVRRLLGALGEEKVAGVVLDLRSNGGGLLEDAVELTGLLVDQGPVVQVKDGAGEVRVLTDDEEGLAFDRPVVVLVDRFSASASEIVAAALQDYRRAIVVGTGPTHGKGTVQTLENLDRIAGGGLELGSLKLTVQQFYRVNGASTQLDGVTPDVVLPDPAAHAKIGERALPHAIGASRIDAVEHADWPARWDVAALARASAARVGKDPLWKKVVAATAVLGARGDETRLPLQRAAFEALRKRRRLELDKVAPDLDKARAQLTVTLLEPPAPDPSGRKDDRLTRWQAQLARDPWLTEAARVLADATR